MHSASLLDQIVVVGVNHRTAPVDIRERLAISPEQLPACLRALRGHARIREAAILSTCNRTELYTVESPGDGNTPGSFEFLCERGAFAAGALLNRIYRQQGSEAVRHLMRVAGGLDSMVVGEAHIQGQVRQALQAASDAETLGMSLRGLFDRALTAGKRVRSETALGHCSESVPTNAVALAIRELGGSLEGKRVVLLGSGKMGTIAAREAYRNGAAGLRVVRRRLSGAAELAESLEGTVREFSSDLTFLDDADVVIACTNSPVPLVGFDELAAVCSARAEKKLVLIDISVPRNVDPRVAEIPNVVLHNIDDLMQVIRQPESEAAGLSQAASIVEDEISEFEQWLRVRAIAPVLAAFQSEMDRLKSQLLSSLLTGNETPEETRRVEWAVHRNVQRHAHRAMVRIQAAPSAAEAQRLASAMREVFSLHDDESAN